MEMLNIEKLKQSDFQSKESYKNLRTNIMLSGKENKVIMLTSCSPNEGKSTVSFNVALSMAESGKKVLFLDLDLRKSVLVGRYKIRKAIKGITHYLSGQSQLSEVVYKTNCDGLHVIFSGPVPPNPAELLDSPDFRNMMKMMKEEYDYVIVDTPPLGSVIDAAIVAQSCDAAVLVVAANSVSYKFAQNVMEQLKKTKIRIIGAVLNKVDLSENGYYGKYYGRYYGKYYGKYYGNYGHYGHEPEMDSEASQPGSSQPNANRPKVAVKEADKTAERRTQGKPPVNRTVPRSSAAPKRNVREEDKDILLDD